MKVRELIEELKEQDPNAEVGTADKYGCLEDICGVSTNTDIMDGNNQIYNWVLIR